MKDINFENINLHEDKKRYKKIMKLYYKILKDKKIMKKFKS
jgi:hypothetical protein